MRRPAIFVSGVHKKCTEPETVGQFSSWARKPPETSRHFRDRGCRKPENVGKLHHGGANRLRRPAIFASGVHKKCSKPETVGNFYLGRNMGMQTA